jgi:uncharacterized Tic20 family protein
MPVSPPDYEADTRLAVTAQVLYLVNLLLLPGLAFVIMLLLYMTKRNSASDFSLFHLRQAISATLWAGILLVGCNVLILLTGGYDGPWTWVIIIIYFTMAHSTLIILGMIALIKAMAGQYWRYPLIGKLPG